MMERDTGDPGPVAALGPEACPFGSHGSGPRSHSQCREHEVLGNGNKPKPMRASVTQESEGPIGHTP